MANAMMEMIGNERASIPVTRRLGIVQDAANRLAEKHDIDISDPRLRRAKDMLASRLAWQGMD